jgi:cytochrome c-type biogenesis protein CcmH/NrfG
MRAQNPAVIALLDGAYQQSESGQLDLAASKLERAVRISPRDPQVWSALAKIRLQQKKYALAVSLAKKSNLLSGGDKNLQRNNWLLMAESYDNLGQTESARQARQRAERLF